MFGLLVGSCVADVDENLELFEVINATYESELDGSQMGMMVDERGISGPSWAKSYTRSTTGCPCWWDLTQGNICACCKDDKNGGKGQPCGYPMHNYCQRKRSIGCPGLLPNGVGSQTSDYERYTLSTRGYPCHYDKSDNSCAWCVYGNQQCGKIGTWANTYLNRNLRMKWKYKQENTCLPVLNSDRKSFAKGKPWIACVGQPQDCSEDSECDTNARCVDTGVRKTLSKGKTWKVHRCACKTGYVGNGITCANARTGIVTRPGVEVKTRLTTDVWEQYQLDTSVEVANNDDFMKSLNKMLNGGSCGSGCNADVVTC